MLHVVPAAKTNMTPPSPTDIAVNPNFLGAMSMLRVMEVP
jgi:hypothetical protein